MALSGGVAVGARRGRRLGAAPAHFEPQRLTRHPLERRRLPGGGPNLQLRVTGGANLKQIVVASIVQLQPSHRLRVAAIEALRQAQNGGEGPHRPAPPARELAEPVVAPLRRRLAVIAGDQRDRFDLLRIESAQIAVLYQIVRMSVMLLIADVDAGVVQDGGVLEPFALAIGQAVNRPRGVEQRERQARDLLGMFRPVMAPLGQFEHAAAAHVGVPAGLDDFLAMLRDVVEYQAFTQRQIAERDLAGRQTAEKFVEQDDAGDDEVRASRLEAGYANALVELERDEILSDSANLFGRHPAIPQRRANGQTFRGGGDGTKT